MLITITTLSEVFPEVAINPEHVAGLVYINKSNSPDAALLDHGYTVVTMASGEQYQVEMPLQDVRKMLEVEEKE